MTAALELASPLLLLGKTDVGNGCNTGVVVLASMLLLLLLTRPGGGEGYALVLWLRRLFRLSLLPPVLVLLVMVNISDDRFVLGEAKSSPVVLLPPTPPLARLVGLVLGVPGAPMDPAEPPKDGYGDG